MTTRVALAHDICATQAEVFDRARLMIDLDEATAPASPASTLLVVGALRSFRAEQDEAVREVVARIGDRLANIVTPYGSVYRTRSTEVVALLDIEHIQAELVLEAVQAGIHEEAQAAGVAMGYAALPDEANEATAALALADQRLRFAA